MTPQPKRHQVTDRRHGAKQSNHDATSEAQPTSGQTATPQVPPVDEDTDRYLRLAAEFENYKRRTTQELIARSRYASEAAARSLLPVLDTLQRAVEHAPEDDAGEDGFATGVRMAVRDFESTLEALGVTPIYSLGEAFDPSFHEAIGSEEADVEVETVIQELQRGWMLHDRVLRPAMVRVGHPRVTSAVE